jgi:hypothetical protein
MLRKLIIIMSLGLGTIQLVDAAQEVGCICKDGSTQSPDCGACGTDLGTQEQTADGANCFCELGGKQLKAGKASCADACALNGGWTGNFE